VYTHLISHVSQVDYFNKQCQIASHWGNVNKKQTPVPVVTIFHICYVHIFKLLRYHSDPDIQRLKIIYYGISIYSKDITHTKYNTQNITLIQ
jgi:hypothetical protein